MRPADDVADILGRWREQAERGRHLDPRALLERHPEHAEALAEGIEMQGLIDQYFAEEDALPFLAPERLGDYRIVRELGRGGMGVVYEAEQESMQRRVALKVLYPTIATTIRTRKRFEREARITGRLHHTNIVTVHAMGQQDGYFYFAMELVQGRPLDDVIAALRGLETGDPTSESLEGTAVELRGRRAHERIAEMAAGVADALQVAHAQGVVHRDVKPSNLVLDDDGVLKLTDFGLAHLVGEDLGVTRTGEALGTPRYMSPEQVKARREDVDHRTDIYSLGATLYELLTREPPHDGSDIGTLCSQILKDEPVAPRQIDPSIPKDLATVVEKALQKERGDRYAAAADMAYDLRAFAEGRPIRARPLGPVTKAWRAVKRHKIRATLGAAVIALAAVGAVLGLEIRSAHEAGLDSEYEALVRSGHESMAHHGAFVPRALTYRPRDDLGPASAAAAVIGVFDRAISVRPERYEAYFGRALVRGRPARDRLADIEAARERGLSLHAYHVYRGFLFADAGRHEEAGAESARAEQLQRDDDRLAFFAGKVLAMRRRNDEAIELFSTAIQSTTPADTLYYLARYERGLVEEARGNYPAAIQDYSAVAGEDGRDPTLAIRIAHLWRELGHEEQAEAILASALDHARKRYQVDDWRLMWSACAGLQEHDWTERVSRAAVERFPDSARMCAWRAVPIARLGDDDGAQAQLARAELLSPGLPAIDASRSEVLIVQRHWAEAEKLLKRLVEQRPDDPVFLHFLALAYSRQKKFDQALTLTSRLVEREPYNARLHADLAAMLLNVGRYREAEQSIAQGLALDSRYPRLYDLGALLANRRGHREEEMRLSQIYVKLAPRSASAWAGVAAAHNNRGQFVEGEREARRALEIDEMHQQAWFVLGFALEGTGRPEEALEAFRKAQAYPEDVARLARALGRPAEARAALERAMARKPRDDTTLGKRARELYAVGRLAEALADLDAAIRLAPSHWGHHVDRARSLSGAGQHDEAEHALRRAASLGAPPYFIAFNRGLFCYQRGLFQEALPELLRAAAKARTSSERAGAEALTRRCKESLKRQRRLAEFLAGGDPPQDARETLELALLCLDQGDQPSAALRLFRIALKALPEIAENPLTYTRYNAACAASRAGDAQQALAWLRADLTAWAELLNENAGPVARILAHWKEDPDLAPIRDADDRAADSQVLWSDVDALLKRAEEAAAK